MFFVMISNDYCITFSIFILYVFLSCPNRILHRAKHEIIKYALVFKYHSALGTFRVSSFVRRFPNPKSYSYFHGFRDYQFSHRFVHRSVMGIGSILGAISQRRANHFGDLFATLSEDQFCLHFGRPLAHFWHPLASKWFPLGSQLLPFGYNW